MLAPFGLEHVVGRSYFIRCGAQYIGVNLFSPFIPPPYSTDQVL